MMRRLLAQEITTALFFIIILVKIEDVKSGSWDWIRGRRKVFEARQATGIPEMKTLEEKRHVASLSRRTANNTSPVVRTEQIPKRLLKNENKTAKRDMDLVKSYNLAATFVALVGELKDREPPGIFQPMSPRLFNNAYRWGLRHLHTLNEWLDGKASYGESHQVGKKRWLYHTKTFPKGLRWTLPFISEKEWAYEDDIQNKFETIQHDGFMSPN